MGCIIHAPGRRNLADVHAMTGEDNEQAEANARLISAAPELLNIAIAYRNYLRTAASTEGECATYSHIEGLIARITGK